MTAADTGKGRIPLLPQRRVSAEAVTLVQSAIGQIVISFAQAEMNLDFWLVEVFPRAVHRNVASKMPYQFGHKLDVVERAFQRIPELQPTKADALAVIARLRGANVVRNHLVHGSLSHAAEEPEVEFVFAKLTYDKANGIHIHSDTIVTARHIVDMALMLPDLIAEMQAITKRLIALPEEGKAPRKGYRLKQGRDAT